MSSTSDSLGRRAGRAFTRLVVTLLVFALLGAVGFLLAQLNARTFTLQQQDGKLLVMKGRMLPVGSEPYRPSDPALAAVAWVVGVEQKIRRTRRAGHRTRVGGEVEDRIQHLVPAAQSHRHPLLPLVVTNRGLGGAGPQQGNRPAKSEQIPIEREDRRMRGAPTAGGKR